MQILIYVLSVEFVSKSFEFNKFWLKKIQCQVLTFLGLELES